MIVIDASVAIKLIIPGEEGGATARKLLDSHLKKEDEIIVPSFLFIEVANVLATKTSSIDSDIKRGISALYRSDFLIFELTEPDLIKASLLAKQYETSVYDMLYAIIAKNKKIKLITADEKFVEKVGFSYVKHLSNTRVE